ncbi:HAD-IIIC family phosphatase [Streptomyces sp. C8S0]|uniref:HAD-IIIC family phosphatase n=1 Tax=Streptomyces sp. C8S0 TaxID=2585716 RepID=UPI00299F83D3|nr:HAD-IIIC family phosphatase [Streptomyces sp. C8S0]
MAARPPGRRQPPVRPRHGAGPVPAGRPDRLRRTAAALARRGRRRGRRREGGAARRTRRPLHPARPRHARPPHAAAARRVPPAAGRPPVPHRTRHPVAGVQHRRAAAGRRTPPAARHRPGAADRGGRPAAHPRLAAYAEAHLGGELLGRYARQAGHLLRALRGRAKKVLVVDLDNTLWDGVLGDDGPDGIAAATTYRGAAFGRFQRVVKQIGSQGVLLAVCSKNDRGPVLDVLRTHPDMALREDDFVCVSADWEPKDGAVQALADRLNLATDSFVFADDSPFERGLVASSHPGAAVVPLDEEPALHVDRLLADGWFDVPELTAADRGRAAQYRQEAGRQDLRRAAGSAEEYLRALGVTVEVAPVRDHEVARVAQLTLRTNQFNLTTRRLQPPDVRERLDAPGHLALAVRSRDRFGDNGVVGALFAHREDAVLYIDNVLLSCRVFARGIEQAALAALLEHARDSGAAEVRACFRPTAKNHRVRGFYPSLGSEQVAEAADGTVDFRHPLTDLPAVPGHVTLDAALRPGPC